MNRRTRKAAKHAHARQRASERFGVDLSLKACKAIVKQIKSGKAVWLSDDENGRKTYLVSYGDTDMRVVYDPSISEMITVLPLYEQYERNWC